MEKIFIYSILFLTRVVFVVSFSLLLVAQIIRMITEYGDNRFDYTG